MKVLGNEESFLQDPLGKGQLKCIESYILITRSFYFVLVDSFL